MKTLLIHHDHDASCCVVEDERLIYYCASERLSRVKHDQNIECLFNDLKNRGHHHFDIVVITRLTHEDSISELIDAGITFDRYIFDTSNHHKHHAYSGFLNSGFDESMVFVLDGAGSLIDMNYKEIESVYHFTNSSVKEVYKHYHITPQIGTEGNFISEDSGYDKYENGIRMSTKLSVGWMFEKFGNENGFGFTNAGKIMGLSQYYNNLDVYPVMKDLILKCRDLQVTTQNRVLELIREHTKEIKNVVISGGYGLNCVSNYNLLKELDINLHVDPLCFDAGIPIGAAVQYANLQPFSDVYIGNSFKPPNGEKISLSEVVDIICNQEAVAIYQGRSEAGQRALGNRSILFDPRNPNGKDLVNKIKKREKYRPFAASVLLEHVNEWFEMRGMNESRYMMYAVDCKKPEQIPAVVHVDNTCRIQTVSREQNSHYYDLINEFYKRTGVPMLLNTSLNLRNQPLVEDASDIDFKGSVYFPENSTIITNS